jgi:SAM-dependent methyltransferase
MTMPDAADTLEYYSDKGLSATFYDVMTLVDPTVKGDVDFYRSLAGPNPRRILVLGCGTGRVAIPLAEAGHHVVGVEIAHAMHSRAELKKKRLAPATAQRLDFRRGDMTNIDLNDQFDLILIPYHGLSHLPEPAQRARTMAVVSRHLAPQGSCVIHVPAPWALREAAAPGPRPAYQAKLQSEKVAEVSVRLLDQDYDEERQTVSQTIEYVVKDIHGEVTRRSQERLTMGLFDDEELKEQAAQAGLRIDRIMSSFQPESGRQRIYALVRA